MQKTRGREKINRFGLAFDGSGRVDNAKNALGRIRRCGQKVGLNTLKREIERCIQKNNITKLSRFMKRRDQ